MGRVGIGEGNRLEASGRIGGLMDKCVCVGDIGLQEDLVLQAVIEEIHGVKFLNQALFK